MPLVDNTLLNLHNVQIMLRPDVLLFEHSLLQLKPLQGPPLGHLTHSLLEILSKNAF